MSRNKLTPDMKEAKIIIGQLLESEEKYRRELGAFGPKDRRTIISEHMYSMSMDTLRWWYNSRLAQQTPGA